jgi:hypothetical protein
VKRIFAVLLAALFLAFSPVRAAEPKNRKEVDRAIERGLEFLHRTQEADGAWKAGGRKNPAITSFAVMAFLSAGHVPGEGKYGGTVERGVAWVLKNQQVNGLIATEGHHEMYHHGICTLMLAEAAGMAGGKLGAEVRKKLEKAVTVILDAQRKAGPHKGGWRYTRRGFDGDISVTGWQLMALRAAKNLGCDVPPAAIDEAVKYVLRCREPSSGGFRYQPGSRQTTACTGTSVLALELCGKKYHNSPEVQKAGAYLLKNLPRWGGRAHFFYEIYYGSQATFQLGGTYWNFYRPQLHEVLLRHQQSNGSWSVGDGQGPIYGTAMAILALTVEYRFLPIYQRGEEPTGKN